MLCARPNLPALILILAGITTPALGQNAFETSTLGAGLSTHLTDSPLNEYWRMGTGYLLWWNTPFYLGELEFRAARQSHIARRPDVQPDLTQLYTSMTWGLPVGLSDRVTLFGGISIGNSFYYRTGKGPFDMPESEFSAGVAGRLTIRVTGQTSLQARLQRTRVYTFHRIDYTWLTIGVERRFQTPDRIKSILQ